MSKSQLPPPTARDPVADDPKKYFSKTYLIVSVTLSILGMAIVFYYTYTPGIFEHMAWKRLPGLLIALVVSFLRIWFNAAKIRYLSEYEFGWIAAFRIILVWDFTSAITPSSIGGAPVATYVMTKENVSLGKATAIMLFSLLLDMLFFVTMITVLVIAGFYLNIVPKNVGWVGQGVMFLIYVALLTYALFLAYALLVNPAILKKTVNIIFRFPLLRRYRDKMTKEAENLEQTSHELRKKPASFLLKSYGLGSLSWLCRMVLPTIVVLSFLPADVVLSFLRSIAMNLAGLFMPTPGGSGGLEGLFAIFQGPLMTKKGFIAISVFMWRFISYYISIGLGMMALTWYFNRSVAKISGKDKGDDSGKYSGKRHAKGEKARISM